MALQSYVLRKWRIWLSPVFIILYFLFIFTLSIPYLKKIGKTGLKKQDPIPLIGGIFVILTIPIAVSEIMQHMIHHSQPHLQKHIIRILWMVPIYAINAWLGLADPTVGIYVDCARECYEAYVIYNFLIYLLNFLSYKRCRGQEMNESSTNEQQRDLVSECKRGILQYTVVRPITTGIALLCHLNGVYGDGQFRSDVAYPYIVFINNLSQFVGIFYLTRFYKANERELAPMKPVGKFICIKAVIFFSFLQQVAIALLAYFDILSVIFKMKDDQGYQITNLSYKLQNFLLCIEMFIAAIAHHYSFSHKPFINEQDKAYDVSMWQAFFAMIDFTDIGADLRDQFGNYGRYLRFGGYFHRNRSFSSSLWEKNETTPLLKNEQPMEFPSA